MNLYPGPRLSVKVKARPSALTAGHRVRVTATVTGRQPGETLGYEWDNGAQLTYGGGNPLMQPFEPRHLLRLRGGDGEQGLSGRVAVYLDQGQ